MSSDELVVYCSPDIGKQNTEYNNIQKSTNTL